MVVYNFDKVVRVKLLLPAGSANKNIQLRTIFNNNRSTFYDSFVDSFNKKTSSLPNDMLIRTIAYIPVPGSNAYECKFEIKGPSLYNLFKKFNFLSNYYNLGLVYFKISLFDLYVLSLLKNKYSSADFTSRNLKYLFSMFLGSFYSYSVNKKNLLFVIKYIKRNNITFYNILFFNRFYRTFFKQQF